MIADHYLQLRSELETALAGLLKLGSEIRRPSSVLDTIHALLSDVRDPLLFVAGGGVKIGRSLTASSRALSADSVFARFQRGRYTGHEHNGFGTSNDYGKLRPARRPDPPRFFRGESLDAVELGFSEFRAKEMAQECCFRVATNRFARTH